MKQSRILVAGAAMVGVAAMMVPAGAQAASDGHAKRVFYATDSAGKLLAFTAKKPRNVARRAIRGLPAGVSLAGIDFRPATGDLYGVGTDSVVYRVNPHTAIAVAEAPAFTPALSGGFYGVDFNPVPDRIRLTSTGGQNLRLHPDDGNVVGNDMNLNPGMPTVVGSAYTNSAFRVMRPTMTTLYALDAATDMLCVQSPPNDGTLANCKSVAINIRNHTGFDIAGPDSRNVGFVATRARGGTGSGLWRLNLSTGQTRYLGRIGKQAKIVTGLAAVQNGG